MQNAEEEVVAAKTVTITLDGAEVSGHPGMTILELADELGIEIPRLCYDPHLSAWGACRICLVEDETSGKLVASCVTPISDGMIITTRSKRVLDHRRTMVELMLASHPDSCIVCDKGNRCRLREIAADLGIGSSSLKRIPSYHPVVDLNPFIQRDLSKCIRCGRCIRADKEIAVVGAIDYAGRGFDARPATLLDVPLERTDCTFCGTCVSVCPTGALLERGRVSTVTAPHATRTVCGLCGVGCAVVIEHDEDVVLGVRPVETDGTVNHVALCAKGHYGLDFVRSGNRLTTPLLRRKEGFVPVGWDEALAVVVGEFTAIKRNRGGRSLGALGASTCTNEENYLLQKLVRAGFGCNNIDSGARLRTSSLMLGIQRVLGVCAMTNPIAHIREALDILVVGADPLTEHPIVGNTIKQAVKLRGARLILVDPVSQGLDAFSALRLNPVPGSYPMFLAGLVREVIRGKEVRVDDQSHRAQWLRYLRRFVEPFTPRRVEEETGVPSNLVVLAARHLRDSRRLAVIPGSGISCHSGAYQSGVLLAAIVLVTGNIWKPGCGLFPLAASLNDQGCMDMGSCPDRLPGYQALTDISARIRFEKTWGTTIPSDPGCDYLSMLEAILREEIAGLYVVGENHVMDGPDAATISNALTRLKFLVVQDRFMTETARLAHVLLPSAAFVEKEGTWTNIERRVQQLSQALKPVADARPDWEILTDMLHRMGLRCAYRTPWDVLCEINETVPLYRGITREHLSKEDVFWPCTDPEEPGTPIVYAFVPPMDPQDLLREMEWPAPRRPSDDYPFWLITRESLFLSKDRAATANSPTMKKASRDRPVVHMHPADAGQAGIREGSSVLLTSATGTIECNIGFSEEIPRGIIQASNTASQLFSRLCALPDRDSVSGTPFIGMIGVRVEVRDVLR